MTRTLLLVALLTSAITLTTLQLHAELAQAPAAPVAAPAAAPVLDKLDQQALALVVEASKAANVECRALDRYKLFESAQALVNAQLKVKYPGYALDWQTQKLAPSK